MFHPNPSPLQVGLFDYSYSVYRISSSHFSLAEISQSHRILIIHVSFAEISQSFINVSIDVSFSDISQTNICSVCPTIMTIYICML